MNIISNLENYKLVGFIDDDPSKIGRKISNYQIFSTDQISDLVNNTNLDEIFVAIGQIRTSDKIKILKKLENFNVKVKLLPNINELIGGNISISDFREISVLDLVERQVEVDFDSLSNEFIHQTIIVTGAGGSIGSELCNQLIRFHPKNLILIDNSEYNLYLIEQKLNKTCDRELIKTRVYSKLVDVKDPIQINKTFAVHKPDFIFHAAAYKHVPLVEQNIIETINNNFFGTINVIDASIASNCKKLVLISTDKAVRPSNIMGATKRLSEMYLQSINRFNENKNFIYSIVRFGNVLDSSGSVVPLFKGQLNKGGPLTVTDPEVTRYFMTIPEATSLILQSSILSRGGEIFVLDMGKPIKILDLAKKMISLSGFSFKQDDKDYIEIVFTGLRDGEKLHEELFFNKENATRINKNIFVTNEKNIDFNMFKRLIVDLEKIIKSCDEESAILFLKEHVEDFKKYN